MVFTPVESSIGGILIGIAAAAHLALVGNVTGLSGEFSRVFRFKEIGKQRHTKSTFYLLGLIFGGFVIYLLYPSAFISREQKLGPPLFSNFGILVISGLLVGFGTRYGSGCTSGHMICGVARLSKRSIVATITFCTSAILTVKLFNTAALTTKSMPYLTIPNAQEAIILFVIVAVISIIYLIIFSLQLKEYKYVEYFVTFFDAFVFGTGLAISGMSKPQKILGFFDFGGKNWDPSLILVAIFATGLDIILFNVFILPKKDLPKCAATFDLPMSKVITKELILGSFLFGIGWGLSGVCPGPAFISSLTLNSNAITVTGSMIFGFILYDTLFPPTC